MNSKKFFKELKRRNVYKVALTYGITAWLLAQVASLACSTFGAPDWVMKMILVLLIIGFPVALIFAWAYEMSPQGLIRTTSSEAEGNPYSERQKRPLTGNLLIGFLILLVIGQFFYNQYSNTSIEEGHLSNTLDVKVKKSIAVLPFKNWSGDYAHEYFCDGMTDEVISRLSKIKSLDRVVSRTSVFKYKETDKSITEIAKELGVSHILEGSFQKSGDQVKIVLQLIDATNDDHFWSEEYTGQWNSNDVFRIQGEEAETVAKKLNISLTNEEARQIALAPTTDNEAYKLFLQAEFQRNKSNKRSFLNAIPLYEKAIAMDPNFYQAYNGLAHTWQTGGLVWGIFEEKEAKEKAKTYWTKSVEITENLWARQNLFMSEFYFNWNFEYCEKEIEGLLKEIVDNGIEETGVGDYLMKVGRAKKSVSYLSSYIEKRQLPDNFNFAHLGKAYFLAGEKEKALEIFDENDILNEHHVWFLRESAIARFWAQDHEGFQKVVNLITAKFNEDAPIDIWFGMIAAHLNENPDDIDRGIKKLEAKFSGRKPGSPAWFLAMYHFYGNDDEKAFEWLSKSYKSHEVEMTWLREEPLLRPYIYK